MTGFLFIKLFKFENLSIMEIDNHADAMRKLGKLVNSFFLSLLRK